ncbi:uncharacterized protein LAESUDRAFT_648603 [Laetiporus sulphureus 93-53]|uniref:Uncharacterized protein n=1 Tax=Laetiporus sulphureus 93-53 TaxID=1314785 RepID=A0A165FAT7_9APHY|nr:uncharacterized protein LAESUDRAFT_648603 [Laetiporus sulphureus 93-53]KZT08687.1 hypothetical protein LAESUDRAFT_648603 [Laetiporus sulphureus 93-53]
MATWGIGDNHDSDEVKSLKDQLRHKDAQIATLGGQLLKREEDFKGLSVTCNENTDKLRKEADRALELEEALTKRTDELQNERMTRQNTEVALAAAQNKLKEAEQATQELYGTIHSISTNAGASSEDKARLEKENTTLHARVRALQSEIAAREQAEQPLLRRSQPQPSNSRRSSGSTTLRLAALERENSELQACVSQQASELLDARNRLSRAQDSLVGKENEKHAMEKRLQQQLDEVQAELKEQQDELKALQGRGGEDAAQRETDLLERLEEEETRIAALEKELTRSMESRKKELSLLQKELDRSTVLLKNGTKKLEKAEAQIIQLMDEKEEGLAQRKEAYKEVEELKRQVQDANFRIRYCPPRLLTASLPSSSPRTDAVTEASVQRLLSAIDRLRGERDQLRRDLEFLSAENKFAVEDLQAKLAEAMAAPSPPLTKAGCAMEVDGDELAISMTKLIQTERTALVFALVAQHAQTEREAGLSQIEHLLQQLDNARWECEETRNNLAEKEARDDRVSVLEMSLETTMQSLRTAETQVSALRASTERLQSESSREHEAYEETRSSLAEAQACLVKLTQALADAEAQRDSLALELQYSQQELKNVREELDEANKRYGQHLRSMSHTQQTRALQEQIEALEQRVLRRTEQIGVHQHDIKRLETNLKLQEERVAEMTTDLEVMLKEKEAMVEDCKTTREQRNEALNKCEQLEEKTERLEDEKEKLALSMSDAAKEAKRIIEEQESQMVQLKASLSEADAEGVKNASSVLKLNAEHAQMTQLLDDKIELIHCLLKENEISSSETVQAIIALATVRADLRVATSACKCATAGKVEAEERLVVLQQELDVKVSEFAIHKAELETKLEELHREHLQLESMSEQEMKALRQSIVELHDQLSSSADHSQAEDDLRSQLEQARSRHSEEIEGLQSLIERLTADLHEAQRVYEESNASRKQIEDDFDGRKRALEQELEDALAKLQAATLAHEQLAELHGKHQVEQDGLREELSALSQQSAELDRAREELIRSTEKLEEASKAHTDLTSENATQCEELEGNLTDLKAAHVKELEALQEHLSVTSTQLREAEDARSDLNARYRQLMEESSRTEKQLQDQLSSVAEEIRLLKSRLEEETELQSQLQKERERLREADARRAVAEEERIKLSDELTVLRAEVDDVKSTLQATWQERDGLQCEITKLEADIQRFKSLQRFTESQAKESATQMKSLKSDLDEARELAKRAENSCKAAEATLSMREIQHEQTVTALRRDLNVLRSSNLDEKVAELEESNVEMEELLKKKCQEIEDNDDRYLELLKEKKKLTGKIESLTRKLNALQSKATASAEMKPPTVETATESSRATVPSISPVGPRASASKYEARGTPSARSMSARTSASSHSRTASGSSVVSTAQMPDSSAVPPTVFRSRTADTKRASSQAETTPTPLPSSSSSSSLGKRRVPDDFDSHDNLPPQGFTSESLPSRDIEATPRARKALQTGPGFTPVRGRIASVAPAEASPSRRATPGAALPDVTNSLKGRPRDETKPHKGWLAKARNDLAQSKERFSRPQR